MIVQDERRQWPRRPLNIQVCLKCWDFSDGRQRWHVGETIDVSVEGMRVKVPSIGWIQETSVIEVLYFLPNENNDFSDPDADPLWMSGRLVWQDGYKHTLGLELIA
jgi:PilZ domain